MSQKDRQFVDALARGLAILECLSRAHHPIGNRAISETVGLAPSTVSRLTHTLNVLGYIRPTGSGRAYELTPKSLTLGYPVLAGLSLRDQVHPHLEALSQRTGETAALAIRDKLHITFVAVEQGTNLLAVRLAVGGRLRMQVSAAGIALVAGLPDRERRMLAGRLRADLTRRGEPTEPFDAALDDCLENGFAIVRNSWRKGVGGVAVPISFQDETAALTIPVATGGVSEEEMRSTLAELLMHEASAF